MIIRNNSGVDLMLMRNKITAGEDHIVDERAFDTHNIFSDIGGVEIVTEYSQRIIRCYGNLIAEEIDEIDDQGLKVISIKRKTPKEVGWSGLWINRQDALIWLDDCMEEYMDWKTEYEHGMNDAYYNCADYISGMEGHD